MADSPPAPTGIPSPPPAKDQKELAISLKVMRLSYPSFAMVTPSSLLRSDIERDQFNGYVHSPYLGLPNQLGETHVGETFSCFIAINNESPETVTDVIFKTEVQTTTKKVTLIDNTLEPLPTFGEGSNLEYVVKHKIDEIGAHILVCTLSYTKPDGEVKNFKKFFKFAVSMPCQVTTKIFSQPFGFALQAILTNTTTKTIYLEKVQFIGDPCFIAKELTPSSKLSLNLPGITKDIDLSYLKGGDSKHYLVNLEFSDIKDAIAQKIKSLGHWRIKWKFAFGETGELLTEPLHFPTIPKNPIDVHVTQIPQKITVDVPFQATYTVFNNTDKPISLKVAFTPHPDKSVLPIGPSVFSLPSVGPLTFHKETITLIPLKTGVLPLPTTSLSEPGSPPIAIPNPIQILVTDTAASKQDHPLPLPFPDPDDFETVAFEEPAVPLRKHHKSDKLEDSKTEGETYTEGGTEGISDIEFDEKKHDEAIPEENEPEISEYPSGTGSGPSLNTLSPASGDLPDSEPPQL